MGVKRHRGKWQVDLRSEYVGVYTDEDVARMVFATGERMVQLGKPVALVIDELRGRVESTAPTLDAYAQGWFADLTLDADTVAKYRLNYGRFSPHLGHMKLDAIGPPEVRRAVGKLAARYAPKTVRVSTSVLRSILTDAVDSGLIERSPASRISNLPAVVRQREPHVLTREEHKLLIEKADERHKPMLTFWPLCGLRVGELSGLLWDDVHADRILVRRQFTRGRVKEYTKTRKRRWVDLAPSAVAALEAQRKLAHPKHGLVFPAKNGGYLRYDIIRDLFADLRAASGLEVRPHDLRHTFGSWLIRSGADIVYVSTVLGHSSPTQTMKVYIHDFKERDTRAMPRFQEWVDGDTDGTPADD